MTPVNESETAGEEVRSEEEVDPEDFIIVRTVVDKSKAKLYALCSRKRVGSQAFIDKNKQDLSKMLKELKVPEGR